MKIAYIDNNGLENSNLFRIVTRAGKTITIGDYDKEEPRALALKLGYMLKGEI